MYPSIPEHYLPVDVSRHEDIWRECRIRRLIEEGGRVLRRRYSSRKTSHALSFGLGFVVEKWIVGRLGLGVCVCFLLDGRGGCRGRLLVCGCLGGAWGDLRWMECVFWAEGDDG